MSQENKYTLRITQRSRMPRSKRLQRLGYTTATSTGTTSTGSTGGTSAAASGSSRASAAALNEENNIYAERVRSDDIRSLSEYSEGNEGTGFRLWHDTEAGQSTLETHNIHARSEITLGGTPIEPTEAISDELLNLICI